MADLIIGAIKFPGDFGKIPKIIFNYQILDSNSGKTLESHGEPDGTSDIFPDIIDDLSEDEKIDLYYYMRQWFIDRKIKILNGDLFVVKKDVDGDLTAMRGEIKEKK